MHRENEIFRELPLRILVPTILVDGLERVLSINEGMEVQGSDTASCRAP